MKPLSATVRLQMDPATGDLMLPIPDAWLEALDWRVGDVTVWAKRPSGVWELTNRTKTERDQLARQADHGDAGATPPSGRDSHDTSD